ncbi:MAG: hypothetical protein LBB13_02555, partial [Rickettsiales bacterium]|nr:hypothetical protein [Rickettsiales bacterium]
RSPGGGNTPKSGPDSGGKSKDVGTSPTAAADGKTSPGWTTAKDSSPVGSGNTSPTGKTAAVAPVPSTSVPGDRRDGAMANIPSAVGDNATSHIRSSPQSAVINTTSGSVDISDIGQNINQPNISNKNRRINLVRNMNHLGLSTIDLEEATSAINLAGKIMDNMLSKFLQPSARREITQGSSEVPNNNLQEDMGGGKAKPKISGVRNPIMKEIFLAAEKIHNKVATVHKNRFPPKKQKYQAAPKPSHHPNIQHSP